MNFFFWHGETMQQKHVLRDPVSADLKKPKETKARCLSQKIFSNRKKAFIVWFESHLVLVCRFTREWFKLSLFVTVVESWRFGHLRSKQKKVKLALDQFHLNTVDKELYPHSISNSDGASRFRCSFHPLFDIVKISKLPKTICTMSCKYTNCLERESAWTSCTYLLP